MNSLEDLSKENFNISKMLYGYFGLKTMNYKLGKQISLDNSNNQLEMYQRNKLFFLYKF